MTTSTGIIAVVPMARWKKQRGGLRVATGGHEHVDDAVTASAAPDFGPSVKIIDPSMSLSDIKATLDSISAQQVPSQFGTGRYAVLFMPGTYGTAQNPLKFQVGYYTDVAGLGASPNDVTINGEANVHNQCFRPNDCTALVNFWRSLANLTINVPGATGCDDSAEFWATSQATSMRRVQINGFTSLMDYCSQPAFASGGFIADSKFTGSTVLNGSQQQYLVRNSDLDGWTNGVWNQVFAGDQGSPAQAFPSRPTRPWRPPPSRGRSRSCTWTRTATSTSGCPTSRRTARA